MNHEFPDVYTENVFNEKMSTAAKLREVARDAALSLKPETGILIWQAIAAIETEMREILDGVKPVTRSYHND